MAVMASDGPSPYFPSLRLWPSRPPVMGTPPRIVPAGPLISWPKNASCSRIPPRLSSATMSDDMLSALTSPLHYASILQPASFPQVVSVAFEAWTISAPICLNRSTFAESRKSAYVLHMRRKNLVLFPSLYTEPCERAIEIIFHYWITSPCHKINLFKRPFRGSRFERLDDAFGAR